MFYKKNLPINNEKYFIIVKDHNYDDNNRHNNNNNLRTCNKQCIKPKSTTKTISYKPLITYFFFCTFALINVAHNNRMQHNHTYSLGDQKKKKTQFNVRILKML